nr:hypothetical protein NCPCFENI_01269 [Cupriavidus sp.]
MQQGLDQLGPARKPSSAAHGRLILLAQDRALTDRTAQRHLPGASLWGAQGDNGAQDLGNHIAGPSYPDRIAHPQILAVHLVFIVQGGVGDHHPAHAHWREPGHRGKHPGAAHLHIDTEQPRTGLFGGEFIGQGKPRGARDKARLCLMGKRLQLYHYPIDFKCQAMPVVLGLGRKRPDLGQAGMGKPPVTDRKAQLG